MVEALYSGWLCRDDSLSWTVNGVYVDPATRTRREEYSWAFRQTHGSLILDAATGYVPNWHMYPYLVLNVPVPRTVVACDFDPRQANMPAHPAIIRQHANICILPFLAEQFDTVACISTLEHLPPDDRRLAAAELLRVCKPGGRLVLTADLAPWLPTLYGLPAGSDSPDEPALAPAVYALAMRKL